MEIYINQQLAVLKKDTSFEYVSENRLFTGSDDYTLTVTFPLRGCPQNVAIFGNINRKDVATKKIIFDCEMRDKNFLKYGTMTITEISEAEVKTQFLEGRSEQNYDSTFDDVYVNELDLGEPKYTTLSSIRGGDPIITPEEAWDPSKWDYQYVALPWVNDYSGNIQNLADYDEDSKTYSWNDDCEGLSWQPYLLDISKKICEAVGYTPEFTKWEEAEDLCSLLICNALPYAWELPEFARALPHWTVDEYFEKLELFLGGEFDIDHRAKTITFAFTTDVLNSKAPVQLEKVIEEHTIEVDDEGEDCDYIGCKNLEYAECDHEMWKYYSCDWFIKAWKSEAVSYDTMSELLEATASFQTWDANTGTRLERYTGIDKLYYAANVDAYFIVRPYSREEREAESWESRGKKFRYTCRLQPVNLFGGHIVNDDEDADSEEIEFVPAWIDDTDDDYGRILFLSFSDYDEDTDEDSEDDEDYPWAKTHSESTLEAGEAEEVSEYYDVVYIGWYDGSQDSMDIGKLPRPYVESVVVNDNWQTYFCPHFSLRLNSSRRNIGTHVKYNIDPRMKTTIKFLSDTIPDARALYLIHGKRYICEKLTATFTEKGMSQLIKGVFYPVVE